MCHHTKKEYKEMYNRKRLCLVLSSILMAHFSLRMCQAAFWDRKLLLKHFGLIVISCVEGEKAVMRCKTQEMSWTAQNEKKDQDEKKDQGPDTTQTPLSIFTGIWGNRLQAKALKPFPKMSDHHCSSAQEQNHNFTHHPFIMCVSPLSKDRSPACP